MGGNPNPNRLLPLDGDAISVFVLPYFTRNSVWTTSAAPGPPGRTRCTPAARPCKRGSGTLKQRPASTDAHTGHSGITRCGSPGRCDAGVQGEAQRVQ